MIYVGSIQLISAISMILIIKHEIEITGGTAVG